ncbi:MAG: ATP-binding protein, partial [Calditrichaceae bacterium]
THQLSSDIINTIFQDSNERIWFGTENGGLMCFNGKNFDMFNPETGYPINSAVSITEDSLGNIWFLSSEDKLFRLTDNEIYPVQGIPGIEGKTLYSVMANNDNLWIGTTNGLCKTALPGMNTTHYGLRSGYPVSETNENAAYKDSNGNLWFGTVKGVVKVIPDYQKSISEVPVPDISKIQIFLQDTAIPQDKEFKYNQNHITFHFRSVYLTAPEQIKYKYILKGFDDHWSPEITNDYVTYSNLSPGEYVFEVMACNSEGEWNQAAAQFSFEIKRPFWQTWWFYVIPMFIIGFLIYILILQRIRSIEKTKMILENRVKLRTRELQEEKTKFEEANRALLAEKERLVVTLRSIGEGVITTDENGKITMINSTAESICELNGDDAMGKSLSEVFTLVHKKTGEKIIDPVDRIKESGELFTSPYNNVLVAKSGSAKNVSYSGSPIRDKDSHIMGIVIVFRDITDQLKMEKELIKNQKLESLGVLAGGIAHDFNNLLTAVTGNISLSKIMLSEDHEMYHRLDLAEKASDRARDLIQQLMTFSKGGTPVKQATSILELVKETTEFVLRGSKVKYEMDFPEDLFPVEVDPGQMNQVIHNIILNANQAMPDGGTIKIYAINKTITAKSRVPLKPGNYIRLTVEDNGPGIKSSYKQKIFDPFFTTKTDGSGLGLASAFSIIKRHQGFITVDSEKGKGSKFKIYLPATSNKIKNTKVPDTIDYKGKGKILVMDDENFVRDTASDMISFFGFDVVCVKDGNEVIEEYKTARKSNNPYNAVILDLTIPGGMGGELAVKRLLHYDPKVTAIVASGYSTDPIMANYSRYGFKARLTKPYNLQEVGNVLRSTLHN